jgi:hypothetical protein
MIEPTRDTCAQARRFLCEFWACIHCCVARLGRQVCVRARVYACVCMRVCRSYPCFALLISHGLYQCRVVETAEGTEFALTVTCVSTSGDTCGKSPKKSGSSGKSAVEVADPCPRSTYLCTASGGCGPDGVTGKGGKGGKVSKSVAAVTTPSAATASSAPAMVGGVAALAVVVVAIGAVARRRRLRQPTEAQEVNEVIHDAVDPPNEKAEVIETTV